MRNENSLFEKPWGEKTRALAAHIDIDAILTPNARLPMKYWRRNFWFSGVQDKEIHAFTGGLFAPRPEPGQTHPVFVLRGNECGAGCNVCPCTSKKPRRLVFRRFIRHGCILLHTGHEMDRNSYLVDDLAFLMPVSVATRVSFRGEVPDACIAMEERGSSTGT